MTPAVASLREVVRCYRRGPELVRAVDGVTLTLDAGTVTGLVGPSGSGKTTLIELLVGWQRPDSGAVIVQPGARDDWNRIAIIPQDLGLIDDLDLVDNIELPSRLGNHQPTATSAIVETLGLVGLEHRRPDEMSLGEQQRVAIARALVAAPMLLVADEPTAHQDEANALGIVDSLVAAARLGSAVLVTTHDRRILPSFDRTLEMQDGRIVGP